MGALALRASASGDGMKKVGGVEVIGFCCICDHYLFTRMVFHWARSRCGLLCVGCAEKQDAVVADHDGWPCEDRE